MSKIYTKTALDAEGTVSIRLLVSIESKVVVL